MTLDRAKEIVTNRHDYAREWKKKTGSKVMGYFCTYVPEEIVYAAGVLPVRVIGSHEAQSYTEPHIYAMFCPFSRDVLAQGLRGKYDYLDGIMIGHSCLHLRQAFGAWMTNVPASFSYYMYTPAKIQSPHAKELMLAETIEFKKAVENWLGRPITDGALDKSIEVYNTNRRLLKQIYELRKADPPPLFGSEAIELVLSSQLSDKAEHNKILESVLKELPQRRNGPQGGNIRLMIIGSEDDDTNFLRYVEGLGATIVADEHCTGSRYFWNETIPEKDRLRAIGNRYVNRPPCPTKDWESRRRFVHIMNMAKEYNIQGAILVQQKFCDPHEFDIPPLKALLEKNGIPSLFLEFDITVPIGQFRTRVEAFLEMLQLEVV
ncbi:MAG: benzoyl-CoA reductase, bzd-type, subunit N [Dehalococcoidia bacterium]|nr:benzoyl-CoA reductase, bzd-type, subunit N [Dehalococcoidia bacterium]